MPSPRSRPYYQQTDEEWAAAFRRLKAAGRDGRILLKGATLITIDPSIGDFDDGDLLIRGQLDTPEVVTIWTSFSAPPKTPEPSATLLATIRSHPLRLSLRLAFSMTFSVSAANPTTSLGRVAVVAQRDPAGIGQAGPGP